MGDSQYLHPVALTWSRGPQQMKKLKNKLQAYFQSKMRSNGGECEIRDTDCSRGYILIHFKEEEARDRVLQKESHSLKLPDGETLQLNVQLPEHTETTKPSTPPHKEAVTCETEKSRKLPEKPSPEKEEVSPSRSSSLVLIENIQESCNPDILNLLVEIVSDRSMGTDFYIEMIPESRCAVITFTCDIDTAEFIEKFSSSQRVQEQKITARILEESRTVRVEGISPQTPEEMIPLYFESAKNGGGHVENIVMLLDENAALVTFQQAEVLKTVMTRQHVLHKKTVYLYPYYPSIGRCLYGKEGPHIDIPDPMEISISQHLLELICKDEQTKLNFTKIMAGAYCDITWPSLGHPTTVLKLSLLGTLSGHQQTLAKIVPTWSKNVRKEFELFISKYTVIGCDLKPPVWEAIKDKMSSSSYSGVHVNADLAAEKAFIVGITEEVKKIEPIFRQLVEDTTRQLSRVEADVPLEPEAYKLMLAHGLEKRMSPHVEISYDGTSKTVKLCGPNAEVLAVKCEILNSKQDIKSKSVNLDPYIVQFLRAVDNGELSCSLLMKNNIKASFHVQGNAVMFMAYSDKDLKNAEETLKRELVCKRISVEDKSVTQGPQWENVKTFLNEMYNAGEMKVCIEEFPVRDGNEVVITGLSLPAEDTYQQIHDFVQMNTTVQKDIKLKSPAVLQFMEEKRKLEWNSILQNVTFVKKQNFLTLTGPKPHVEAAESNVRQIISRLYPETLYIDKPGVKTLVTENEDMYATTLWNKYNCVLHLQKEVDDRIPNLREPHCQVSLQNKGTLVIYKGDLCQHNVDVIIIASSKKLQPAGALALTLANAAGPNLQKECERIVQKEGELEPGECAITDAGNLQCKKVIHAYGPIWHNQGNTKCERLLRKVITQSLETAADNGQSSVALSVGDFVTSGCPLDPCAQNIVKSIKSYTENQERTNTMKNIHLVDSDEGILQALTKIMNEEFEEQNVQVTLKQGSQKQQKKKPPKKGATGNKGNDQMVTTKEGLNINIREGNIEDATSDVVVNSVGKELNLRNGAVAKALSRKAGSNLQDLLNTEAQGKQVEDGSIFVTDSCNLSCDTVIHAVVPQWDGANGSSLKILRKIVSDCLSTTEEEQSRSITFPAIGTGILRFPRNTVAALMFEEILEFSSKHRLQYLKQVDFMLHPSDEETIKAFSSELEKKISSGGQKKEDKSFLGNVKSPAQDVYEMKIGSVTYQVKSGDITKEKCDVIINSTNPTFNLKSGVSKAILEAAGPTVENECALLAARGNNKKGYAVTGGGNLQCNNIIHLAGQNKPHLIMQCVTDALHECERQGATSVAFPALGTGAGSVASAAVADAILDALVDFVKSKSAVSVQNVTVVIFQPQMLKDFHDSMKRKETPPPAKQSWFFSKITSFFGLSPSGKSNDGKEEEEEEDQAKVFELRENIEPAIIHLCAESGNSVKEASDWLREMITKDQHDNTITDDWIQHLDNKDCDALAQLQKENRVHITFDSLRSTITVAGRTKDVLEVSNKIQDMIKGVRDKKTLEREAELCSNVVEWGYYRGTSFVPFDKMTNLALEKADQSSSVNIEVNGVQYTAIVETKSARDAKGNTITLLQNRKNAESLLTPPFWDAMDNTQLKVVPLNTNSPDYSEVLDLFTQTCQMRIIKIERIQNKPLYQNYQIKKAGLEAANRSKSNEKRLFHGTDGGTTDNINRNGFNRAYAGSNAAKLGKGTYFAVEANYSADDTYSKPDRNGYKYVYLARVLTGIYCVGNNSMIAPPAKSASNPTDLYDSVTDNLSAPAVFVIFNDIQAYPEYLITFTQ